LSSDNYQQVNPDFLVYALGSRQVRNQIEEFGKTTAGQIGVSGSDAKSVLIPVPPLEEQRRIVAYLDGLQGKVDALKQLQAQTQVELDALLPSVLDKAFRGELL
jgi:type I restriction enzyme S subunit